MRFLKWCLFIYGCLVVLGGCFYLVEIAGLTGWLRFVVLIPVLILFRVVVQRYLRERPP